MVTDPASSPFRKACGGVQLRLRLTPKASANRISGVRTEADAAAILHVQVTAVPESGKANAALIKLLAREWKLAKSSIQIIRGVTDRNKTVLVAGDTTILMKRMHQWASEKLEMEKP